MIHLYNVVLWVYRVSIIIEGWALWYCWVLLGFDSIFLLGCGSVFFIVGCI
jgi:hypothetical protein